MLRILAVGAILIFASVVCVDAEPAASAPESGIVHVGNQFCPVSGDKVNPDVSYVHEGKRYLFCCKMCIRDFKKDPAKYIDKMKPSEEEAGATKEHAGHEHGAHEHGGHEHGGQPLT